MLSADSNNTSREPWVMRNELHPRCQIGVTVEVNLVYYTHLTQQQVMISADAEKFLSWFQYKNCEQILNIP